MNGPIFKVPDQIGEVSFGLQQSLRHWHMEEG